MTGTSTRAHGRHRALLCSSALTAAIVLSGCGSSSSTGTGATSGAGSSSAAVAAASPTATGGGGASSGMAGSSADPAIAAMVPAKVRSAGVLKVATGSGYPPFEFYDGNDKTLVGVDPEIMQALGAVMGLKVSFADLKFDAIIPGLQSSRYDVASAAMGITPVRNKVVDFVSYFKGGTSLIVKAGNPLKLTLETMCGTKIAVEKGTIYANDYLPEFSKACTAAGNKAITVDIYPDQPQATLALSSGRDDASISDYGPLAYIAQEAKGKFEVLQQNYKPSLYGIGLTKGSALTPAIKAGLTKIIADGTYKKILDKWQVEAGAISDPTISTTG